MLLSHLMGRLRYRHWLLLTAIADHGNLHRAADALHLAQPSATKLVHDLEQLFGFPLFQRLPRGMLPTELGAKVVAFARRALVDVRRFALHLDNKQQGAHGQLFIGAIMGAAADVVAHAMAELKQRRPLLAIRLWGETSDEIVQMLLERKIDVGVGRFSTPLQHNDVDCEVLGNEELCVVAAGPPLSRAWEETRTQDAGAVPLDPPASGQSCAPDYGTRIGTAGMKTPANIVESASIFAIFHSCCKRATQSLSCRSLLFAITLRQGYLSGCR